MDPLVAPLRTFIVRAGDRVVVSRGAAEDLSSVHRWELKCEAFPGERFTRELPKIAPELLAHLDDLGFVRAGTAVEPGTVLVGKVSPRMPALGQSIEERTLEKISGPSEVRDSSLRCPPTISGTVEEVRYDGADGTEKSVFVHVSVVAERALAVGDVLRIGGDEAPVAELVEALDGADLEWPGLAGEHTVEKMSCAIDVLHARSIGPYSLVTQQPLGGKSEFGGQRVEYTQLQAMLDAGAIWTVYELITVKSDEPAGRVRLYESIVRGDPRCEAGVPRATRVLERELLALGFDVDFEAEEVEIELLDDDTIRELMPGTVTKPETLNYRTYQPVRSGLFCEEIFGPVSGERATKMGHIALPVPVLHPWALAPAATLLGLTEEQTQAVLDCQTRVDGSTAEKLQDTGGAALRRALDALDLAALAGGEGPRAQLARTLMEAEVRPGVLCVQLWPVLPPDLRPLVPLSGGRWATSDLNDLYRRLINRSNRLWRLLELSAPDIILLNEARQLQESADALVENGLRRRELKFEGRALVSLADLLQGPNGRFRANLLGKRVDYSAIARVVPRASLGPARVAVPRDVAFELFKPWIYAELERAGHVSTIKAAKQMVEARDPNAVRALDEVATGYPVVLCPSGGAVPVAAFDVELWDAPAFGLAPAALGELQLGAGATAILHVPIDPRAKHEAETCLRRRAPPSDPVPAVGWIARTAAAQKVGPVLMEAALQREVDPVTDRRTRLILGRRAHET